MEARRKEEEVRRWRRGGKKRRCRPLRERQAPQARYGRAPRQITTQPVFVLVAQVSTQSCAWLPVSRVPMDGHTLVSSEHFIKSGRVPSSGGFCLL